MVSRMAPKAADACADAAGHAVRVRETGVNHRPEVGELGRETDRLAAEKRDARRVAVFMAALILEHSPHGPSA